MKKNSAAAIAIAIPCLTYLMTVSLTDRIFWDTGIPAGKSDRAAIVIRDNVTPFQKWGSRQFTLPYLKRYYGAAWYTTAAAAA